MKNDSDKRLLAVVYDGIANSVFYNLFFVPLLQRLADDQNLIITLVSFESDVIGARKRAAALPPHERLNIVIMKRYAFIGTISLLLSTYALRRMCKKITFSNALARGPLAGWVLLMALKRIDDKSLDIVIQARGLCAEEYRYAQAYKKDSAVMRWLHVAKYRMLHAVEQDVYRCGNNKLSVVFEVVSPALKEYLIESFGVAESRIVLAQNDLIAPVSAQTVAIWRKAARAELGIPADAYVYCYSGSHKPWQCADESIDFFVQRWNRDKHSFLLILSQDVRYFTDSLNRYPEIPKDRYCLTSVPAAVVLKYLAAADAGILLRHADVINWVSRPTKMLEYQALGLLIVHNGTIAWLADDETLKK